MVRLLLGGDVLPTGVLHAQVAAMVEEAKRRAGSETQLTGRAVASMLHGRDMPAFPRAAWSKCPGWATCIHVRFGDLRKHAQAQLLQQL